MQSQAKEARNTKVIRFIYKEGNESEIYDPLQGCNVEELRLDHGDPALLVQKQAQKYLSNGRRTCDRYKKLISLKECYSVATKEENQNTLFLIPEGCGIQREVPDQSTEDQKMIEYHRTRHQEDKEALEDWGEVLLDLEMQNAANSRILDSHNTVIYIKIRVEDSHDVSQPAKHWEWREVTTLEVPMRDTHKIVERKMQMF